MPGLPRSWGVSREASTSSRSRRSPPGSPLNRSDHRHGDPPDLSRNLGGRRPCRTLDRVGAGAGPRRRAGRRLRRDYRGAHAESAAALARRHAGRTQPGLHRLSVQQQRAGRVARPVAAAVRLRRGEPERCRRCPDRRHRGRCRGSHRLAGRRQPPVVGPPRDGAGHRHQLVCPAGIRRGGGAEDAACLEGRTADGPAARPVAGDGGRRPGRHVGTGQSLPLSARSLREGQPGRLLAQAVEAEVEAPPPRRQGCLFQAAAVPERVDATLPGPGRMGGAQPGRKGDVRRSRDADLRHRLRSPQGGGRQRHPAPEGRRDRPAGRRRGPHRLVPGRAGCLRVDAAPRHTRDRRCGHHGRHAEVRVRRQCPGQGLRRGDRRPAGRPQAGRPDPDQHLLQLM